VVLAGTVDDALEIASVAGSAPTWEGAVGTGVAVIGSWPPTEVGAGVGVSVIGS